MVKGIKHQNQDVESSQNQQIKVCSLQLMEVNPSIRWQYFHMLEAFHLLAFGYNWVGNRSSMHVYSASINVCNALYKKERFSDSL